jgi:aminoglycoside 2''-phosphotransferase
VAPGRARDAGQPVDADAALRGYAELLGLDPTGLILASGQTSDVVVDAARDEVWRFPRYASGVAGLALAVARTEAAVRLGILAPEVLEVAADGPVGRARVGFRRLPGVGVSPLVLANLGPAARSRFCSDLADLLLRLRSADAELWPAPEVGWVERWQLLADRIRTTVLPQLSRTGRARAERDLAAAVHAAEEAPAGVLHGDLGGTNLLVDPVDGRVTGVLDWDGAGPGDPAVDHADIRSTLDRDLARDHDHDRDRPSLLSQLLAVAPVLVEDLRRSDAYLGTFALQEALHGALSDDAAAWKAGSAGYQ